MEQETPILNPFVPLENRNDGLQQRLEEKLNNANGFNISNNIIKEMITYFTDKNHKPKQKQKILNH